MTTFASLLCGVVAIFVMRPLPDFECASVQKVCEPSALRVIENVDVFNIPPEIEGIPIFHDGSKLIIGKVFFGHDVAICARMENALNNNVNRFGTIKRLLEREFSNQQACPMGYLIGGGLPVISQNNSMRWHLRQGAIDSDHFGIRRYISSKLSLGGVFGFSDELLCTPPKKPGGKYKGNCGDRKGGRKFHQPPIGIGFVVALFGLLSTFFLGGWGYGLYSDNKRRFLGASVVGLGFVLGGAGLFGLLFDWWV